MSFDRSLVDRLDADADMPARAIAGLSKDDLLWTPPPGRDDLGAWSIQTLIVHLMDSHISAAWRMRKIVAEDNPLLTAYDENAFAQRLGYDKTDAAAAADIFRLVQRMNASMLRALPDEAFDRTGIHTESGKVTLASLVPGYIRHLEHHMTFLRAKRAAIGKPLAE